MPLPELSEVTMRVRINSAEVATPRGDAVLGHSHNSMAWLASRLADIDGLGRRCRDQNKRAYLAPSRSRQRYPPRP